MCDIRIVKSMSNDMKTIDNQIPAKLGTLHVTEDYSHKIKRNSTKLDRDFIDKLVQQLYGATFDDFELVARLGYNGSIHVTYSDSELHSLSKENIITANHHYIFPDQDDSTIDIASCLEKMASENKITASSRRDIHDVCNSYASAANKVLKVMKDSYFEENSCTDIYFIIARPTTSDDAATKNSSTPNTSFESHEFVMYLLKHNPDYNQKKIIRVA